METKDKVGKPMESGWGGPGMEVWPEEDDYIMWRSMKNNEKRHLKN